MLFGSAASRARPLAWRFNSGTLMMLEECRETGGSGMQQHDFDLWGGSVMMMTDEALRRASGGAIWNIPFVGSAEAPWDAPRAGDSWIDPPEYINMLPIGNKNSVLNFSQGHMRLIDIFFFFCSSLLGWVTTANLQVQRPARCDVILVHSLTGQLTLAPPAKNCNPTGSPNVDLRASSPHSSPHSIAASPQNA